MTCYEINTPSAAGEIIDGEAIILHLSRGHYFSAEGSAALIWAGIEQRLPLATIAAALSARFSVDPAEAGPAVETFVAELAGHDLVRAADPAADAFSDFAALPQGAYFPPRLDVYTDMQDIMELDPIHDVDQSGWPVAPGQFYG